MFSGRTAVSVQRSTSLVTLSMNGGSCGVMRFFYALKKQKCSTDSEHCKHRKLKTRQSYVQLIGNQELTITDNLIFPIMFTNNLSTVYCHLVYWGACKSHFLNYFSRLCGSTFLGNRYEIVHNPDNDY